MFELPDLAGGVRDGAGQAEFVAQVVDLAGQQAGLDDNGGGSVSAKSLRGPSSEVGRVSKRASMVLGS
jgi:hypothetical protein